MSHANKIVKPYQVRKEGPVVVVIPKKIREQMKIQNGTMLQVRIDGNSLVYSPVPQAE